MSNTDTSFVVNFAPDETDYSAKYWARLSLAESEVETVSLSQAAQVVDSIYDLDPCISDESLVGGEEEDILEEEEAAEKMKSAFNSLDYSPCKFDKNSYNYEAVIYVRISHLDIGYKLYVEDGTILSTTKLTKRINTIIQADGKILDTNYPISGNIVCDKKISKYDGSIAYLSEEQSGYIAISFDTVYYKVVLKVEGTEESQDGVAILFYKGVYYTLDLEPPEEDLAAINLIGCTFEDEEEEEEEEEEEIDTVLCYQRYIYETICNCSGNVKDSRDEVKVVACPDSYATFHSNTEEGAYNFWWQAKYITEYVDCHEEAWEGSEKDFYIDNCCNPPPYGMVLPTCQKTTATWYGGAGIINGVDYYKALNNQTVSLIPVPPENGICGTITTSYEVESLNCCDDPLLTKVVIDTENSADIISDNSSASIFWEGGKSPYEISVRGSGFYLDSNYSKTDGITDGTAIIIYTKDACGSASITITDGCSEDSYIVRSTEGEWEQIASGQPVIDQYRGSPSTYFGYSGVGGFYYYESGAFRVEQRIAYTGGVGVGGWVDPNLDCLDQNLCGEKYDPSCSKDVNFYGLLNWETNGCLLPPQMPLSNGYSLCYQLNCMSCESDSDHDCGENHYSPSKCLRNTNTRYTAFSEPILLEWKC